MSTPANRILGEKYRLVRALHAGGMGSVWLGEHLSLGSPVAIKLIGADGPKTEERMQRFLREARAAAALRSPHVVQILDYGVDAGTPYIVMELLEGESLAERLLRLGRLDPLDTERVIRHVSRAVSRAHDLGVVHRDLKPANIFITHDDEQDIIKLFDFGIAKATLESSFGSISHQTRTGRFLGTPAYMSPEQFEGSRRCDHRTDIWAMGVIAFECLLGRLPFVSPGIGGLVMDICSRPLPVPSAYGAVPVGFDAWFARACARKLDDRFPSAREAAQEFSRLLEAGPERVARGRAAQPSRPDAVTRPFEAAERPPERGVPARPSLLPALPSPGVVTVAGLPPAALPSSTGATSSITIDRGRHRSFVKPLSVVVLLMGIVAVVVAVHRIVRRSLAPETVVQASQPLALTSSLRVLGDGADLRLRVDGKELGPLPQELHALEPGEHALQIAGGARYHPYQARVTLEPGRLTSLGPVQLGVAKGLATVVAGQGAEGAAVTLYAGDVQVPLPPLPVQFEVETDKPYVLHARREGYAPYEQALRFDDGHAEKTFSVTLSPLPSSSSAPSQPSQPSSPPSPPSQLQKSPGQQPSPSPAVAARPHARPEPRHRIRAPQPVRAATSAPAPAKLTLESTPRAAVLLDGSPKGTTPLRDVAVTPGPHRVIFIYGGQRQAHQVQVGAGQSRVVSASFATSKPGK